MAKVRKSNIELLRIVSMLMIILLHFLVHGGVIDSLVEGSASYYFAYILRTVASVAVNSYILISGYFMIEQNTFKISKFVSILAQMIFFSFVLFLLMILFGKTTFSAKECVKAFLPFLTRDQWFASVYLGLYILYPFINKLVKNLSKSQYLILLLILVLFASISKISNIFLLGGGTSLCWFVVLYLLGGYMKKYPFNNKRYLWVVGFIAYATISCIFNFYLNMTIIFTVIITF